MPGTIVYWAGTPALEGFEGHRGLDQPEQGGSQGGRSMVTGEHKGLLCVLPFISFFSVLFVSGLDGQYLI